MNLLTKTVVLIFVTIALLGQGVAVAAMSCQEHQISSVESHHHMMMLENESTHIEHDMSHQDVAKMSDECCSVDCQCPVNGCSTLSLLNETSLLSSLTLIPEKITRPVRFNTSAERSNLYRPPILA